MAGGLQDGHLGILWWTLSTLLVGGADNKGPVGVGGRIVAIVWMLLSIVLVSLLTASFTTTLTINTLKGDINGPGDLPGRKVATVKGSTTESWLTTQGATAVPFDDVTACITALRDGRCRPSSMTRRSCNTSPPS